MFGRVVEGQSVVDAVKQGDKIESVEILRVGADWSDYKADQSVWNALYELQTAKAREKMGRPRRRNGPGSTRDGRGVDRGPQGSDGRQ